MSQEPKKIMFKDKDGQYAVPYNEVSEFMKEAPNATIVDQGTLRFKDKDGEYEVPHTDIVSFLKDAPDAVVVDFKKKSQSVPSGGASDGATPTDVSSTQTPSEQSSGEIPTVTLSDSEVNAIPQPDEIGPRSATDRDAEKINAALSKVPEKYLMDKNFANTFASVFSAKAGVDKAQVKKLVEKQQDEQRILRYEDDYRRTGDPAYMMAAGDLHKKLGRPDIAQQAYDAAQLPQVGNGDYHQPQQVQATTYGFSGRNGLESTGRKVESVSKPTEASKYLNDIADANEKLSFGGAVEQYSKYVAEPVVGMIEAGMKKRKEAGKIGGMKGLLHETVGNGEVLLGLLGATPVGQVGMGAFNLAVENIPGLDKAIMPLHAVSEYYKKNGVDVPVWADDLAAVGDFIWMATLAHGAHLTAKDIKGRKFANSMDKILDNLDPTEVQKIQDQVTAKYEEYKDNPKEYHAYVMDKIANGVDETKSDMKVSEGYVPEKSPKTVGELQSGAEIEVDGKRGVITRNDATGAHQVQTEAGVTELPKDQKIEEAGIRPVVEPSAENLAKVQGAAEASGVVEDNGSKFFVSTGDIDKVYRISPDGKYEAIFDNHPDPEFAASRELELVNNLREQEGLKPKTELSNEPAVKSMEVTPSTKAELVSSIEDGTMQEAIATDKIDVLDFMRELDKNELPLPDWFNDLTGENLSEEMGSRTPKEDAELLDLINKATERTGVPILNELPEGKAAEPTDQFLESQGLTREAYNKLSDSAQQSVKEDFAKEANPALKDVESTTKALEGLGKNKWKNASSGILNSFTGKDYFYHGTTKDFSEFRKIKKMGVENIETEQPIFLAQNKDAAEPFSVAKGGRLLRVKVSKDAKIFDPTSIKTNKEPIGYDYSNLTDEAKKLAQAFDNGEIELTLGKLKDKDGYEIINDYIKHGDWDVLESKGVKDWLIKNGYDGVYVKEFRGTKDKNLAIFNTDKLIINEPKSISEAYHKAKADGSNPELVKAVEELLSKPEQPTPVQAEPAQIKPTENETKTGKRGALQTTGKQVSSEGGERPESAGSVHRSEEVRKSEDAANGKEGERVVEPKVPVEKAADESFRQQMTKEAKKLSEEEGAPAEKAKSKAKAKQIEADVETHKEAEKATELVKGADRVSEAMSNLKDLMGSVHDAEQQALWKKLNAILGEQRANTVPVDKVLEALPIMGKMFANYVAKGVEIAPEVIKHLGDIATGLIEEGVTTYADVTKYLSEKMGVDVKPYERQIKDQIEYINQVEPLKVAARKVFTKALAEREGMMADVSEMMLKRGMEEQWNKDLEAIQSGERNPYDTVIRLNQEGNKAKISDSDQSDIAYVLMDIELNRRNLDKMMSEAKTQEQIDDVALKIAGNQLRLEEALKADKVAGSSASHALSQRKAYIKEDYSFDRQLSNAISGNGGKYPTATEVANIKEWTDQIAELQKQIDEMGAAHEKEIADIQAKLNKETASKRAKRNLTREQLDKERDDIIANILKVGREAGKTMSSTLPAKEALELAKYSGQLLRNYVEKGVLDLADIIDDLHERLEGRLDKDIIKDVLAGKYSPKKPVTEDAAKKEIVRLRAEANGKATKEVKEAIKKEEEAKKFLSNLEKQKASAVANEVKKARIEEKIKQAQVAKERAKQYRESAEYKEKKRLDNINERIKDAEELLNQMKQPDYVPPVLPAKEEITNPKIKEAQLKLNKLKLKIDSQKEVIKMNNDPKNVKFGRAVAAIYRTGLLSRMATLGKLSTTAMVRMTTAPVERGIAKAWGYVPGISKISDKAIRYGKGSLMDSEMAAMKMFMESKTLKDAWNIMKTGNGELDLEYGNKYHLPQEWYEIFGRIHGALKSPAKRNEFYRSYQLRLANEYAKTGVVDAVRRYEIGVEAYKDASEAILMGDNVVTTLYHDAIRSLEKRGYHGTSTGLKVLFPIVKVPTNYAREVSSYGVGGIKATVSILKSLINKEFQNMSPEQADYIMKNLTKQTIGAIVLAIGYNNPDMIGGYYQERNRRGQTDVEAGGIRLHINGEDYEIPHWMLHTPLFEMLQVGATMKRVKMQLAEKGNTDWFGEGTRSATAGVMKAVPFHETPARLFDVMSGRQKMGEYVGEYTSNMLVPGLVQEIGSAIDPADTRRARNFNEAWMKAIPKLRERLPSDIKTELNLPKEDYEHIANTGALDSVKPYAIKTIFVSSDGENFKPHYMSDDEIERLNKIRNQYVSSWLKKGMNQQFSDNDWSGGNYKTMSPQDLTYEIKAMYRQATYLAKDQIFGEGKWQNTNNYQ